MGVDGHALRAAEGGEFGRSAVAGEALLARARDVRDLVVLQVEFEDLIAFAGADPEVAKTAYDAMDQVKRGIVAYSYYV